VNYSEGSTLFCELFRRVNSFCELFRRVNSICKLFRRVNSCELSGGLTLVNYQEG
jgi:hypothetical protein